jgi:hypothetical protein
MKPSRQPFTLTAAAAALLAVASCSGGGHDPPAQPASVSLTASPTSVAYGGTSTLGWASTNATSCTASGGWSGAEPTSGSRPTGALQSTTSFTLTCNGAGGDGSATVSVAVDPPPAPTVMLSVVPTNLLAGEAATLTWSSSDAASCTASGGWSGSEPLQGSVSTGPLSATTSFSLNCAGPGGSTGQTVGVTVAGSAPVPAPTVTLTLNPTTIASGGSATLSWSTTNADSCTASGGWSGAILTSGSQSTGALTATTSYTLTCTGAGGNAGATAAVTVTATAAPTVTLTANPTSIASGGSATLSWSTTNANSCTASGGWSGARLTSGSQSTGAITTTTSYTLTCTGPGGSIGNTATVTVAPPDTQAPTVPTGLAAPTITANSIALSWSASTDLPSPGGTGVGGYFLYRNGNTTTPIATVGSGTAYTDSGLTASTTYAYQLAAFDKATPANVSVPSATLSVTTHSTAPPGWSNGDIGSVGAAGSATLSNGTFTVSGSGADIWNAADAFQFVSQPLTGDGSITARVVSQTNTNPWAKAGVMFRETLNAGSRFAAVELTPGNGANYQARTVANAAAVTTAGPATITAPYWARLTRVGSTLTGYVSPDGVTWTLLGQYTVPMTSQIYVGLAVTSHADGTLSTAVFDNVSVLSISVAPPSVSLVLGASQQFAATVTNAANTAVTWQVEGVSGGSVATGTIDATGLYTAPSTLSASPTTFTVTAVSAQDLVTASAAQVTVADPNSVAVYPRRAALTLSQSQQYSAIVLSGAAVNWSVDGVVGGNSSVGTISAAGLYVPPTAAGVHAVTATNASNPSFSATATVGVTDFGGVYTYHNDLARTGQNLQEYALTPSVLSGGGFGKRWSCAIDGEAYAQPLYVANLAIAGGTHNVLIVATQHDSVYAFDADDPGCTTYWQATFLGPGVTSVPVGDTPGCTDILGEYGITGTPVIDPASQIVYLVAKTKESGSYFQRLHALNLATGQEQSLPVTIQASTPISGGGSSTFSPLLENQRPGLVLTNGSVYISWASHCDGGTYHGWVMRYDAATLAQTAVFNSTPNGNSGGIWMSGAAPAVDSSGSIFLSTGNGTFDWVGDIVPPLAPADDFGESFVRLDPNSLTVQDFYTPSQNVTWSANDLDIASAGVTVLPDGAGPTGHPNVLIGADKQGHLWMIDRSPGAMSRFNASSDNTVQYLTLPNSNACVSVCVYSTAGYWNGTIYIAQNLGQLMALPLMGGAIPSTVGIATPASVSAETYHYPSPTPNISASPTGNAIVWVLDNNANGTADGSTAKGPAVLRAYDATNLATTLYSSAVNPADAAGTAVKFTLPVIANGHVYVAGGGQLSIYGVLP